MANTPPRVTLPGSMYQKNRRWWWWKVRLPGEDRSKARALKPVGARCAATRRDVAEQIAREMWERAIGAETEARLTTKAQAEATDKDRCHAEAMAKTRAKAAEAVARAKADFEEKIKDYTKALASPSFLLTRTSIR